MLSIEITAFFVNVLLDKLLVARCWMISCDTYDILTSDCYSQPNLNSEIAWPKQFLWGDIWEEHQKVFIHSSFFHFLNSTFHVYRLFLCLQVSKKVADLILEKQPAYVKVSLQCRLKTTLNNVLCIPAPDV